MRLFFCYDLTQACNSNPSFFHCNIADSAAQAFVFRHYAWAP